MEDYWDEDEMLELGFMDEDEDDFGFELGAVTRTRALARAKTAKRARIMRRAAKAAKAAAYMGQINPAVPGAPKVGARKYALGLGAHTFANAASTTHTFRVSPQKPFKGYRLVAVVNRSSGAQAELLTIAEFNVGTNNQLVGNDDLPLEAFSPNAEGVALALDPATPGINVELTVNISAAPGVGETVSVSLIIIGDTIN